LKLICQIFHFAHKIQQSLTIWNGVKTIEITPNFKWCGINFFLQTSMGIGSRPVTRGDKTHLKQFSLLLEKCMGYSLKLLDIV